MTPRQIIGARVAEARRRQGLFAFALALNVAVAELLRPPARADVVLPALRVPAECPDIIAEARRGLCSIEALLERLQRPSGPEGDSA